MFLNLRKKTIKGIKQIDIFAQPVQLLIKSEVGHTTLFGAGLTLGLITLFLYFLIVSLYTLSLRIDPSSYTTQVYHSHPDYYKYDQSNFTITFSFQSSDYATYIDESIYVVEASLVKKVTKIVDNKSVDEWSSQELPITTCTQNLIRQTDLKDYFSHLDLSTNHCIDWDKIDQIDLEGTFDATVFSYILIQFKMCTEQTKKSKECRQQEEIIQALQNNYFSMQLSSLVTDVKNPTQPFKSIGQDSFTTISSKIFKEIAFYLEPVTIISDFGLFSQNYEELKSLRFKQKQEMLDFNESDLIMNLAIRLDPTEQQYYRNYPKVQSIFGELGGLWNVFFTLAYFIQKPISRLSYYLRILNSLFEFEQNKKQRNNNLLDSQDQELMSRRQFSSTREVIVNCNQQQKALQRLQSIRIKTQKLDSLEKQGQYSEYNMQTKIELSKAISNSIKQYFQSIAKKLKVKWIDYLYFIKCFKRSPNYKSLQIEYSLKKVIKQMDILFIMKKLQEIDKLKMILLTESQIKVFDYLQKPTIPADPTTKTFNQNQQYFSILKPIKSDYQRAVDAQVAFRQLANNIEDPINLRLIQSIDQTIVQLLKLRKQTDLASVEDLSISEREEDKHHVLSIDVKQKANSIANI